MPVALAVVVQAHSDYQGRARAIRVSRVIRIIRVINPISSKA